MDHPNEPGRAGLARAVVRAASLAPMLLATHGAPAQAPVPHLDLGPARVASGDEQITVRARPPRFSDAPLPGHHADHIGDPPDTDPESGATIGTFGPAFGAAAAVPVINPAGNWPPSRGSATPP